MGYDIPLFLWIWLKCTIIALLVVAGIGVCIMAGEVVVDKIKFKRRD